MGDHPTDCHTGDLGVEGIAYFGRMVEVKAASKNSPTPSPNLARAFCKRLEEADRMAIGERIYRKLFQDHPELVDYFSNTNMDSLAVHLVQALDVMVKASGGQIAAEKGPFRSLMNHLGRIHLNIWVPGYACPLMRYAVLECLEPFARKPWKYPRRPIHSKSSLHASIPKS